jgi:DNA topoisomerase-1
MDKICTRTVSNKKIKTPTGSTKTLVIVESPGKINKISQILGQDFIVKASYGHVQNLDQSTLSIDIDNNFTPLYKIIPEKIKLVQELKALAKECSSVILAADGDREGEAIAHSLATVLGLENPKRIVFNEITKPAILKALELPVTINYPMVWAQQTRRILDRLLGYEISPILWKSMNSSTQSAGRVQSVVIKIIIERENAIERAICSNYFKTVGEFFIKSTKSTKSKIKAILTSGSSLYYFESKDKAEQFLHQENSKVKSIIKSIDNKIVTRNPPIPFITSSLQQEASTKYNFSVGKTMELAQKLYEAGLITYMRTDCPNISGEAIEQARQYVIQTYGKDYSKPTTYESKNITSQDAHECIRPTHLNEPNPEISDKSQALLYKLIFTRTLASQMTPAQVNVQTIKIDQIKNKTSILTFDKTSALFQSINETIKFPGFLIIYSSTDVNDNSDHVNDNSDHVNDNSDHVNDNSDHVNDNFPSVNIDTKLTMDQIIITEEYSSPPSRYNEAMLVKYLEKNGIGRPSTYASIISKVIDRAYVEIKDIEGVKKQSLQLILGSNYEIKYVDREVLVGKMSRKLVPTKLGIEVNKFMMEHFANIINTDYTANFETYLDQISIGKANWVTVLHQYYNEFHPIVEKLNQTIKTHRTTTDTLLGTDSSGNQIFTGSGKYGPYVKIGTDNKWKYSSVSDIPLDKITLDQAIELLEWPKSLGKIAQSNVTLNKGPYGYYIKYGTRSISVGDQTIDPSTIDLDYAKKLINIGDPFALNTFKIQNKMIYVKSGDFGPYIQIVSDKTKQSISIPSSYQVSKLTLTDVLNIIANKNGTSKTNKKQ